MAKRGVGGEGVRRIHVLTGSPTFIERSIPRAFYQSSFRNCPLATARNRDYFGDRFGDEQGGGHGAADSAKSRDGQAGRTHGRRGASSNRRRDGHQEVGFSLYAARPFSGNGARRFGRVAGHGA